MLIYVAAVGVVMVGIYAIVAKDNLIKKLIGLSVMSNGIHLFLISMGYRAGGVMPIMQDLDFTRFSQLSVDPLPQALVLTSIVINLSILAVGLSICILIYRKFGTLDSSKVRRLSG